MSSQQSADGTGRMQTIKADFFASIVVFLVALPLCMGIAIASGVPVAAGLVTGIIGGLVVGCLAGSPLQVSGPAAGLTVIVYEIVQRVGLEMLGLAVLLAGALQLLAGALKWGQWFRAVSPAVIRGMLSGIGVLIFASQFHVMVDDSPPGGGLKNLTAIPSAVSKALTVSSLGDADVRRERSRALQQVGELHRQQWELRETLLADIPARVQDSGAEQPVILPESEREKLAARQRRVAEALQNVAKDLPSVEKSTRQRANGVDIAERAEAARDSAHRAADLLAEGRVLEAAELQQAVINEISRLMDGLKNHGVAAQVGLLTILVIVLWQSLAPRRIKFIPAPLIAVVLATGAAFVLALPVLYVEVPDNLAEALRFPSLQTLQEAPWKSVLQSALVIAAVASAETLLCAIAVDQMHRGPRTQFDRELMAQGVGNMLCGFVGALPMTGVIVRSSANVQSGAKTRASAIMHGAWLLIFVAALPSVLRMVPTSTLGAVLVYTGYKLINPKAFRELWNYGRGEAAIAVATVAMIVATDLLTGIVTGIALSAVKLLYAFSHLKTDLQFDTSGRQAKLHLEGAATFIRLPKLAAELERVPNNAELHVDLRHLSYIDHACLELIMNWGRQHESMGGKLVIDWDSMHARFRQPSFHAISPRADDVESTSRTTKTA